MVEKIHSTPSFDGILQKEWFQYTQYSGTSSVAQRFHCNTIASYGCIKNMMQGMVEKSCVFSIQICGIVLMA